MCPTSLLMTRAVISLGAFFADTSADFCSTHFEFVSPLYANVGFRDNRIRV
jgi:hypothetical protein